MKNALNWFEIPVTDIDRAITFYSKVYDSSLEKTEVGGSPYAFLPADQQAIGGGLTTEGKPSGDRNVVVFLNGGDDLQHALTRVEAAGGKVVMPKTDIGENGFIAMFVDSEGNHVGIHSMS